MVIRGNYTDEELGQRLSDALGLKVTFRHQKNPTCYHVYSPTGKWVTVYKVWWEKGGISCSNETAALLFPESCKSNESTTLEPSLS